MVEQKKVIQTMRFSSKELEILKNVFAENEELLLTIRNLFLGLDITPEESKIVKSIFSNKENRRIVRKVLLPEFDTDIPVGQETDYWMSSVEGIKGNSPETLAPIFESQIRYVEMLEKALKSLENPDGERVSLKVVNMKDPVDMYVQILARNNFVKVVATSVVQLRILAGKKTETVEEFMKNMEKNSMR